MKKKYLILFVISLYLMQIPLFIDFIIINMDDYNSNLENILFNMFLVFLILSLILGLINLIMAFTNTNDNNSVIKNTMISKLVLLPYFIINFIISVLLVIGFSFIFTILSTFIIIPLLVFLTFITIFITSAYNISYLISMFKIKKISLKVFIVHFILQLIFVLDVIDTIYIYKCEKNMIK